MYLDTKIWVLAKGLGNRNKVDANMLFTLFVVYESHTISLPSCDADTRYLENKQLEINQNNKFSEKTR